MITPTYKLTVNVGGAKAYYDSVVAGIMYAVQRTTRTTWALVQALAPKDRGHLENSTKELFPYKVKKGEYIYGAVHSGRNK